MTYAPCESCPGEIVIGKFSPIRVMLQDDEGVPILDDNQEFMYTTLRLPQHRARFIGSGSDPVLIKDVEGNWVQRNAWEDTSEAPHSVFDPTGLSPSPCQHGLAEHPAGLELRYGCRSWVRAKYLDVWKGGVGCPVCRGEAAPDDLTTARDA